MATARTQVPSVYRAIPKHEPVVITGIGLIASVGNDRESVWQAVREGRSGVRRVDPLEPLSKVPGGPRIAAPVDIAPRHHGELKAITLAHHVAAEALADARIDWDDVDRERFGCAISSHMGDPRWLAERGGLVEPDPSRIQWWQQWFPNTACSSIANHYGLWGPRTTRATACASGLIDILAAARAIQDDQCDLALAGSAEAISALFACGFHNMRVLAEDQGDPTAACRPFDADRRGFVMGEGGAMLVLERLGHAQRRGAPIYAEILAGKVLAEAHHVTDLNAETESLSYLISSTLRQAHLLPSDLDYVNAHGTATMQNDLIEMVGIRKALGTAADHTCVSSTKSMLGHLINAASSVELAITALALRDGFAPPTINLQRPDPACQLDCLPLVGRAAPLEHALKLSIAFGGHLVACLLRRWSEAQAAVDHSRRAA